MVLRLFIHGILFYTGFAAAEPLTIRVVAANLTSSSQQSYSPNNDNSSNPEGAGARILTALKPDIVLIQEFNTTVPVRQWLNKTLGEQYFFVVEKGMQIPNGIISRFPIAESGSWDDPVLSNREFCWARLQPPEKPPLWVVSLHLHSKGEESRAVQAKALMALLSARVPKDALLIVGGDFNTRGPHEACLKELTKLLTLPFQPPVDGNGNSTTNAPRNRPYDWVLTSEQLHRQEIPVALGGQLFNHGLVFDSRVFPAWEKCPPVQAGDSGVPFMQHMAVVRDFRIP